MREQDDLVLVEMRAEILAYLDAVAHHAIDGHRRFVLTVAAIGTARAALIPLHDGEILLPWPVDLRERHHGIAGAAMDEQDHRIGAVIAADGDVLVDTPDPNERPLVDPVRCRDRENLRDLVLTPGPVRQSHENGSERERDDRHARANENAPHERNCPVQRQNGTPGVSGHPTMWRQHKGEETDWQGGFLRNR